MACATIRINHHVPNFATRSPSTGQHSPIRHDAATDADLTREVEDVVLSHCGAAGILRIRTEIRVISDNGHWHDAEGFLQSPVQKFADRDITPPEVRGDEHMPCAGINHAGHTQSGANPSCCGRNGVEQLMHERRHVLHRSLWSVIAPMPLIRSSKYPTPQSNKCSVGSFDSQIKGDHHCGFWNGFDNKGWASDSTTATSDLAHETGIGQLRYEYPNGAAIQSRQSDEVGTTHGSMEVKVTDQSG
jgi:hypothetical protein